MTQPTAAQIADALATYLVVSAPDRNKLANLSLDGLKQKLLGIGKSIQANYLSKLTPEQLENLKSTGIAAGIGAGAGAGLGAIGGDRYDTIRGAIGGALLGAGGYQGLRHLRKAAPGSDPYVPPEVSRAAEQLSQQAEEATPSAFSKLLQNTRGTQIAGGAIVGSKAFNWSPSSKGNPLDNPRRSPLYNLFGRDRTEGLPGTSGIPTNPLVPTAPHSVVSDSGRYTDWRRFTPFTPADDMQAMKDSIIKNLVRARGADDPFVKQLMEQDPVKVIELTNSAREAVRAQFAANSPAATSAGWSYISGRVPPKRNASAMVEPDRYYTQEALKILGSPQGNKGSIPRASTFAQQASRRPALSTWKGRGKALGLGAAADVLNQFVPLSDIARWYRGQEPTLTPEEIRELVGR